MQQAKILHESPEKLDELIRRHDFHRQHTQDKKLSVEAEDGRLLREVGGMKIGEYFNEELSLWLTEILFRERIFVTATKTRV